MIKLFFLLVLVSQGFLVAIKTMQHIQTYYQKKGFIGNSFSYIQISIINFYRNSLLRNKVPAVCNLVYQKTE